MTRDVNVKWVSIFIHSMFKMKQRSVCIAWKQSTVKNRIVREIDELESVWVDQKYNEVNEVKWCGMKKRMVIFSERKEIEMEKQAREREREAGKRKDSASSVSSPSPSSG